MTTQQTIINANRLRTINRNRQARQIVSKVLDIEEKQILIDTFVAETVTKRKITFRIKGDSEIHTLKFQINRK